MLGPLASGKQGCADQSKPRAELTERQSAAQGAKKMQTICELGKLPRTLATGGFHYISK